MKLSSILELQAASDNGWIGVDLDGTLARYDGWKGGTIGPPIPAMVNRVKKWLAQGKQVKIFTARMHQDDGSQKKAIQQWCKQHLGQVLDVTNVKDHKMTQLYDDRAVGVKKNTGLLAASKHKCPRCGSREYALMPTDFETAKCAKCGKTWDHGIVPGINDPKESR